MNLDELQSIRDRERQTSDLQQLRASFYEDVGAFIGELRGERERAAERADDPFDSPEVGRLTDDIETAEQTVEAIYERRVGKLVKMASFAAADMPADDEGLTDQERELFDQLVAAIECNREHVLDVLAGEADGTDASDSGDAGTNGATTDPDAGADAPASEGRGAGEPTPGKAPTPDDPRSAGDRDPATDATDPGADVDAAALMGGDGPDAGGGAQPDPATGDPDPDPDPDPEPADGEAGGVDRTTIRVTRDVGEILGVDDREYDLSREDIVTLPATNAAPLVERGAAERLD